jgi:hypothetical protein
MERETILIIDDNPVTAYAMRGTKNAFWPPAATAISPADQYPNLTEFYQGMPAPGRNQSASR